jgi:hypothetical protein
MSKPYKTYPGVSPDIQINKLKRLPKERLLLALKRLRDAIAAGRALSYNDEPDCSWGLCHESAETWPDAQDHIFPIDFETRGRVTPLDARKSNECPLDRRNGGKAGMNGCFYTCMVLKPEKGQPKLTRELALARYDAAIARLEGEQS